MGVEGCALLVQGKVVRGEREFNTSLMGSALKQQMYKRGAGFICAQSTVLFHSRYQLETDRLPSCSGTKCDVVRLSPIRRAASDRGPTKADDAGHLLLFGSD